MEDIASCLFSRLGTKPPDDFAVLGIVLVDAEGTVGEGLQVEPIRPGETLREQPRGKNAIQPIGADRSRRIVLRSADKIAARSRENAVGCDVTRLGPIVVA